MIAGGSMIVSPLGNVLAGPLRGEEGYVHSLQTFHRVINGSV